VIVKLVSLDEETGEERLHSGLNTDVAVAADYIAFIGGLTELLAFNTDDLEREANASGRTIDHPLIGGVGSIEHREDDVLAKVRQSLKPGQLL
jgi:hypothetical protein